MKKLDTRGFSVIEGLLILVIVGIIGGVGFYVYNANKKMSEGSNGTKIVRNEDSEKNKDKVPENILSITPYEGEALKIKAPQGWSILEGDDSKIEKAIGNQNYLVSTQITEEDYLKLEAYAAPDSEVLSSINNSNGEKRYLVKTHDNIVVSTCKPVNQKSCSLTQNDKPLLIFVSTPDGPHAPGGIDFNNFSIDELIEDLEIIISSLEL